MSRRLEAAMDILDGLAEDLEETDLVYDVRNVQQLVHYELELRDPD